MLKISKLFLQEIKLALYFNERFSFSRFSFRQLQDKEFSIQNNSSFENDLRLEEEKFTLDNQEDQQNLIAKHIKQIYTGMPLYQAILTGKVLMRLNFTDKNDQEKLMQTFLDNMNQLEQVEIIQIIWICGKMINCDKKQQIMIQLQKKILQIINNLQPSDIALILWGYGKSSIIAINSIEYKQFLMQIISLMAKKLDQLKLIDLANCCWGITKLSNVIKMDNNVKFINIIWKNLEELIITRKYYANADEQSYSTIIWSFAKEQQGSQQFWELMGQQFDKMSHHLSNQGLANSIWAFGKIEFSFPTQKTSFQELIIQRIDTFNIEEVMAIAWGSAKLQIGDNSYWSALLNKIQNIIYKSNIDIKTLSSCAFSLSHLRLTDQQQAIWNRIEQMIKSQRSSDEINITHIVTFINAFSIKNYGSAELWQFFQDFIMENYIPNQKPLEFDSKTFTNILYGFSVKKFGSKQFYLQMVKVLDQYLANFSMQGLIICFWSLIKQNILKNFFIFNYPELFILVTKFVHQLEKHKNQLKFGTTDLGLMMYCLGKMSLKKQADEQKNKLYTEVQHLISQFEREINNNLISMLQKKDIPLDQQMNQQDLAHTGLAFFTYDIGSQEFWNNFQKVSQEILPVLDEENLSLILRIGVKKFDSKFFDCFTKTFAEQYKKYRAIFFTNVLNIVSFFEEVQRLKLIGIIENEVEQRAQQGLISDNDYSLILNTMGKTQIGSADFWQFSQNYFLKSNKIKSFKSNKQLYSLDNRLFLCQLVEGMLTSKFVSEDIVAMFIPLVSEILKLKNIKQKELISYITSFSRAKIADNYIWLQFEKQFLLAYNLMSFKILFQLVTSFQAVQKGSGMFWKQMMEHLEKNKNQYSSLTVVQSILRINTKYIRQGLLDLFVVKMENEKYNDLLLQSLSLIVKYNKSLLNIFTILNLESFCKKIERLEQKQKQDAKLKEQIDTITFALNEAIQKQKSFDLTSRTAN